MEAEVEQDEGEEGHWKRVKAVVWLSRTGRLISL
jgi:hypothetical protein